MRLVKALTIKTERKGGFYGVGEKNENISRRLEVTIRCTKDDPGISRLGKKGKTLTNNEMRKLRS